MAHLHDAIIRELRGVNWTPDLIDTDDPGEEDVFAKLGNDKDSRAKLRLLANAAVAVLGADDTYQYELRRITRINSQQTAVRANDRLLMLWEWARQDLGQDAGNEYYSAAQLADALSRHYSGWGAEESYSDLASLYVFAARGGWATEARKVTLELLAGIRKLEAPQQLSRSELNS